MRGEYQFYCPPGTPFYDRIDAGEVEPFFLEPPKSWDTIELPDWITYFPPSPELPNQGWKIHISATLDNAEDTLKKVAEYCFAEEVTFKHAPSANALFMKNSKYGDRGGSGKFITVFPKSDVDTHTILKDLEVLIGGRPGPYILSDLRWKQGPLFVRYGGFKMELGPYPDGTLGPCLRNPSGDLIPDIRKPGAYVPDWIDVPGFLEEAVRIRKSGVIKNFPYRVIKALHFSNGGGVYKGEHLETGRAVLLKEARPFAGLDNSRVDAHARLERERIALETLDGLAGIPRLLEYRKGFENYFLVREFVDGDSLTSLIYKNNPLVFGNSQSLESYAQWALDICAKTEMLIRGIHSRGIVFGDLHPNNVLVDENGDVSLIDFETSSTDTENFVQKMAAPGFGAPDGVSGFDVDWYTFGELCLSVFVPLTQLVSWHKGPDRLLAYATDVFKLPREFADRVSGFLASPSRSLEAVEKKGVGSTTTTLSVESLEDLDRWDIDRIIEAIEWSSTPDRDDRLFPGDITQFAEPGGGMSFVSGAAGVLWGLKRLGRVNQEYTEWFAQRLDRPLEISVNFAKGIAGLFYASEDLGTIDLQRFDVENMISRTIDSTEISLASGAAGVGLTLLRHHTRGGSHVTASQIRTVSEFLESQLVKEPEEKSRTGYWQGWTGPALFFLRMHQSTNDERYLNLAYRALDRDITRLKATREHVSASSAHQVPIDTSVARGTAGMWLVGKQFGQVAAVMSDLEGDLQWLSEISANTPVVSGPSILFGLSGSLLATDHCHEVWGKYRSVALDLFRVKVGEYQAYVGEEFLRLSMDFGTGATGVALAIKDRQQGTSESLPFLSNDEFFGEHDG
ncbi:class III lanthionine synthetase LanKC [uncultured Actinomyces sp.]|uniref:class III lanthionine synthetase LanKC n=1 Tax=uncultured Actinomyces sp. TaxID=249061 RepID=UPI002620B4DD|nr:class III lanthionine synthetase LanKC [uncultured Actinomyces sp.]